MSTSQEAGPHIFQEQMAYGYESAGAPEGIHTQEIGPNPTLIDTSEPLHENPDFNVLATVDAGGQEFLVLDIRKSPVDHMGRRQPFASSGQPGFRVRDDIDYLVLSQDFDNPDNGLPGIRGVRTGEEVTFGRLHQNDRFSYDSRVSRNHFTIGVDDEGNLSIRDLDSSNGTKLHTKKSEPKEKPWWEEAKEREVIQDRATQFEKAFAQAPVKKVSGGEGVVIDSRIPVVRTEGYSVFAEVEAGGVKFYMLDLRQSPTDYRGDRMPFFNDGDYSSFRDNTDFLLVTGDFFTDHRTGYKGVRKGENVIVGKSTLRDRFNLDESQTMSGEHFAVQVDQAGNIIVGDLNSEGGTTVRAASTTEVPKPPTKPKAEKIKVDLDEEPAQRIKVEVEDKPKRTPQEQAKHKQAIRDIALKDIRPPFDRDFELSNASSIAEASDISALFTQIRDMRASGTSDKKIYAQLVRDLHPDVNPDDPIKEDLYKILTTLYKNNEIIVR